MELLAPGSNPILPGIQPARASLPIVPADAISIVEMVLSMFRLFVIKYQQHLNQPEWASQ